MTPFYPPKGQVMNIENVMRYEKLSFTAKEQLYNHTMIRWLFLLPQYLQNIKLCDGKNIS